MNKLLLKQISFCCAIFWGLTGLSRAELLCPVEIGSGGIKARVVDVTYDEECNLKAKTVHSVDNNANLMQSLKAGQLPAEAVQNAAQVVFDLQSQMRAKYPSCMSFTVGSSGVAAASNANDLRQALAKKGLRDFAFINAEQEADYGFRSSVPNARRPKALLIDIGGGNTKIGYQNKTGDFQSLEIPFGSISLWKKSEESGLPIRYGVAKTMLADILPKFRTDTTGPHAEILKKDHVVWIGGVAWATATYSHPGTIDKSTVNLSRADLVEFLVALEKDTWQQRPMPTGLTDSQLAAWQKDWETVRKIFPRERLIAGVRLMDVMLSEGLKQDKITFPRYGQWLFAYGVDLFKTANACGS